MSIGFLKIKNFLFWEYVKIKEKFHGNWTDQILFWDLDFVKK